MEIDGILTALADPTRREIVELLRNGPRRAGEISSRFDAAQPTISRHLRVLREAGLIEETPDADARARRYQLRSAPFGHLGAWVDQVQAMWRDRLQDFAAYVTEQEAGAPRVEREETTP
jgi:DNA-binding transcriptional ArsR family regulator